MTPASHPPDRTRPRAPLLVAAGLAAVVIIALAVALISGGGDDGGGDDDATTAGSDPATTGTVVVSGTPLPELTDSADDPAVGMTFPTLTGVDQSGEPMTVSADDGPMMVLFVAHWCPHCQRAVPVVQSWVDDGGLPPDVDLVTVSTAIDPSAPNYPPDAWLAREGWTAPVLVDADGTAATAAGLPAYPYFMAVDGDGEVAVRTTGELTTDQLDAVAAEISGTAGS
jgi:cytochrome c biogenesis protein CcmG, thiol:disulfide interchange protein DsbE